MRLLQLSVYCVFSTFLLSSCGPSLNPGNPITSKREVTSFNSIEIDAPVKATISVDPGAQPSVELKGPENIVKQVKTKVENNILKVYMEDDIHFGWDDDIKANIILPEFTALNISGAGSTDINGDIKGSSFSMDISGVGKVNVESMHVTDLSADVSGAGKVDIEAGQAQNGKFLLSGTGYIDAYSLQTMNATTSVSGAGFINVNVQDQLTSDISGVGSVRYKGHPKIASNTSGVGKLVNAN